MNLFGKNYKLVWEDHFDGPKIDEGFWDILHYNVKGHDGRPAWRKKDNCTVKDSNLIIKATIEENGDYVSGMLRGHDRLAYQYGYAEIRAKMPKGGPGIWPGFWMCMQSHNAVDSFIVGPEIDVLEMFGDDSYLACNLHSWWGKGHHINFMDGQGAPKTIRLPNGAKFSEDYHTIGYEWTPELVAFFVDGEPYSVTRIDNEVMACFHNPLYFILSMAFGLVQMSKPDDNRTEPIEYMIDYIRLYQNENGKLFRLDKDRNMVEVDDINKFSEFAK